MLKDIAARLGQRARAPNAPFPVHDGTKETLGQHGLAYYLVPRERRVEDSTWFGGTLWAQRRHHAAISQQQEPPHWNDVDVLLLVQWPMFLRTALTTWQSSPVRLLARQLLQVLRDDLVAEYDYAFALLLKRFDENWTAALPDSLDRPFYFGQEDELDEQRFDAHLLSLLANKGFRRDLDRTMQRSLGPVAAKHQQLKLGLCPSKHVKGVPCALCEHNRWVRRYTSLLWPNRINGTESRRIVYTPQFRRLWPENQRSPALCELRYLLSCVLPEEGVARVETTGLGEALLVDFGRVMLLRRRDGRQSSIFTPFDDPGHSDWWLLGSQVREAFARLTENQYLGRRPSSLKELVEAQGWEWRETLDIPYELLSTFAVANKIQHAKKSARSLAFALKRLPSRKAAPNAKKKAVQLKYVDAGGQEFLITLIQRKNQNYVSTPFPVTGPAAHPQRRKGLAVRLGETVFWTAQGINKLVNAVEGGEASFPWAPHFLEWALREVSALDRKRFQKLHFEQHYGARLLRYKEGKQSHIGRFTQYEDTAITAFLFARPAGAHRLARDEWTQLLEKLPGRTEQGVLRHLEDLGKSYALQHGYAKYAESPLCLRRSVSRRRRWLQEGVSP